MSDLLNQASLVMVPSGYKEDTVYSVVPSDGSGDLAFTRASNGTRVNSAGLVEVAPWNMVEYSEQFDNGVWTKFSPTSVTADTTSAPNGTTTADTISTSATAVIRQSTTLNANEIYTYSIYVKKISYDFFGLQNLINGSGVKSVFDLSNGTVTSQGSGHTASIESVGNGWYRCSVTFNPGSSASNIFDLAADGTSATLRTFYAWGAQTNIGSTAKPYFPTTDRLNVPRLTYQNGGGGCPSLLLEKQSTNLITNSEDFTQTSWTKYQATITGNNTTSPDGTQNADKFVDNTNNDIHALYLGITISSDTTISIYVKSAEYTRFAIANLSDGGDVIFNLSTVAVVSASANFKNNKIESVGNGWYRVSATTNGTSGGKAMGFMLVNDSNQLSFVGTGSKGVYIWGAQYETSSYSTSYIPTTSSSATRVADVASKTGISSLIGQTEGVVFWDIEVETLSATGNENILNLDAGSYGNTIYFIKGSTGILSAEVYVTGVAQCSFSYSLPSVGRYKMALAYKANDFAFYVNGVSRGTDSSGTVPATSRFQLGNGVFGPSDGKTNQCALFKTRLTNAELASLTTL